MNDKRSKRSFVRRLFPWLIVFGVGVGVGYYISDRRQDERVREAVSRATRDLVERGQRAGEQIEGGARAAVDSAREAIRRLAGDTS